MAVEARLETHKTKGSRQASRRELMLPVTGTRASGDAAAVMIHNLSSSGLLLQTTAELSAGQEIVVNLPETERTTATVVWQSGQFFGCSFNRSLSKAALSAAHLRSLPAVPIASSDVGNQVSQGTTSPETFGSRLKRLRKEKGLSLVELAGRMNVSRPTVWSWEAGKSSPRQSKISRLASILGATEAQIMGSVDGSGDDMAEPFAGRADTEQFRAAIAGAKELVAQAAGTSPDKVTVIIEV